MKAQRAALIAINENGIVDGVASCQNAEHLIEHVNEFKGRTLGFVPIERARKLFGEKLPDDEAVLLAFDD